MSHGERDLLHTLSPAICHSSAAQGKKEESELKKEATACHKFGVSGMKVERENE